MTETTAQPLTREDIMAAVIDALNNNTIDVMTSAKPNRFRLISKPEQAARDRHPAGRANRSPAAHDVARPSYSLGPCTAEESRRFARILRDLLAALDGEIVVAAFVGECETDLLDPERQEVHRVREFLNGRITMRSELSNLRGCALAVLDSLADQFETGADHSSSPSVDGCGDLTVGEAGSVGGASVSSTERVMIDSLVESIRDARVDEVAALRLQRAAESNLAEMNDNLAYAKNQTRTAELALLDHINGDAA